jgi:hypothetical protein
LQSIVQKYRQGEEGLKESCKQPSAFGRQRVPDNLCNIAKE